MLALIDCDIVAYRTAFSCQKTLPDGNIQLEPESIAIVRFNEMIEQILSDTGATEYQLWLSDKTQNNFRLQFYPEYKANRKNLVPPVYLNLLKEFAINNWGAQITCNQEADDALGIHQCDLMNNPDRADDSSIICSIDKDLKQIPGNHFNFVTKEKSFVTPEEGLRAFYTQLLVGDTSDHIQGAVGIGSAKAKKGLGGLYDEKSLFYAIRNLYQWAYSSRIFKHESLTEKEIQFVDQQILQNGRCLKIRTREDEVWEFPNFLKSTPTEISEQSSIPPMQVEISQSMEPGSSTGVAQN